TSSLIALRYVSVSTRLHAAPSCRYRENTHMGSKTSPATGTAFGQPGIAPTWSTSSKDGIGTAYSTASHVWFTLALGILTEIYYPTIDRPQIRDAQFLVTD